MTPASHTLRVVKNPKMDVSNVDGHAGTWNLLLVSVSRTHVRTHSSFCDIPCSLPSRGHDLQQGEDG